MRGETFDAKKPTGPISFDLLEEIEPVMDADPDRLRALFEEGRGSPEPEDRHLIAGLRLAAERSETDPLPEILRRIFGVDPESGLGLRTRYYSHRRRCPVCQGRSRKPCPVGDGLLERYYGRKP
ncbi:MAG: hypothetical protein KA419_07145 [Acidobacteria bacterium]|nr:hypothetical protein [Acidobacteriota bacterium]